jgi:hypothetical protein
MIATLRLADEWVKLHKALICKFVYLPSCHKNLSKISRFELSGSLTLGDFFTLSRSHCNSFDALPNNCTESASFMMLFLGQGLDPDHRKYTGL